MKDARHVIWDSNTQALLCTHCGDSWPLNLPAAIEDLCARSEKFCDLHRDCPKPTKPSPASPDRDGE